MSFRGDCVWFDQTKVVVYIEGCGAEVEASSGELDAEIWDWVEVGRCVVRSGSVGDWVAIGLGGAEAYEKFVEMRSWYVFFGGGLSWNALCEAVRLRSSWGALGRAEER